MAVTLDGPRLAPLSRAAEQLVVFLHGYGANGNDLIAIGKQWRNLMPGAAFAAPNAPEPCPQAPGGRQWFRLTMRDPAERWTGVNRSLPVLDAFLDAELERHGLDGGKLALVGFSQGTMLALHAGLRRARAPAAIVGYSGELVVADNGESAASRISARTAPPILMVHGSQDDLIPAEALFLSAEELAKAGIPCQWHLSIGLGHGIDGQGLMHGGLFLAKCFGLKPSPGARAGV
ncbi:MAG: alpha/beta hydrolase [Beijerinckiaceae bacterium]|nr:alpha/beta hydrolase [Beijerinckiaceae bacterium]MCI0735685.1 alpha/beta hydrolase [Beijerinckiaceae bacterium]